jgi:hypothetical protein
LYRIIPDVAVLDQLAVLPDEFLDSYAALLDALELVPWNGAPQNKDNPDGALRTWPFGPGGAAFVVYMILEERREVHMLTIQWVG